MLWDCAFNELNQLKKDHQTDQEQLVRDLGKSKPDKSGILHSDGIVITTLPPPLSSPCSA